MDAIRAVRDAVAQGKRAALVSVTRIEGEPPSREGMTFALIDGGAAHGTLGCDGFDRSAATDAARAIASGTRLERTYDWDEGSRIRVDVRPFARGDAVPDSAAAELARRLDTENARREIQRRMATQLPDDEKVKVADFVIDNSGSVDQTEAQVDSVMQELRALAAAK